MALSLIESIRKLIRQNTNLVGRPVGNIHGAVTMDLADLAGVNQTWLRMTIGGRDMPTLAAFLEAFAENPTAMALEVAESGELNLAMLPATVTLLRTVVTAERTLSFNIGVTVPGSATAAVYVDGTLVRTVHGSSAVPVSVAAGRHVIYVLVSSPTITLSVPKSITLVGETDQLRAPQWVSVRTGYLDENAGTAANTLRWASDPEAGAYRVLRREPSLIGDLETAGDGEVQAVSALTTNDTFNITIQGDHTDDLQPNAVILAHGEPVGVVASAKLESDSVTNTVITCRLPLGVSEPPSGIAGQLLYTGTLTEIARVTRTANTSVLEYTDNSVYIGAAYEYALQATGMVDESVTSPLSQTRYVITGDVYAPAAIEILPDYPQVLNRLVTVRFTTPSDRDYAGVNVNYRQQVLNDDTPFIVQSLTDNKHIVVTITDLPTTDGGLQGFNLAIGVVGYSDVTFTVASNTLSTIVLNEAIPTDMLTAIAAAAGAIELSIWKDTQIKTDYGTHDRTDELSFVGAAYGLYWFASFDRGGNVQTFEDSAQWTYTTDDDQFTAGPILALRQVVSPDEQQFFTGYTDPNRFAIVELFAYSPSKPADKKFEGMRLYYQRKTDPNYTELGQIPQQNHPDFPLLVTSQALAYVDTPEGMNLSAVSRSANVATYSTATAHGISVGQTVQIDGVSDASFNGWFVVTAVTSTTFTAANTGTNVSSANRGGTVAKRSRFILLDRTDDDTRLSFYSVDDQGQESDTLTFVVDLDTTPEISSLETFVDSSTNTASFLGVGDDDTFGAQWWVTPADVGEPTEQHPFHLDMRLSKRIDGTVSLPLGSSKRLSIKPCGSFSSTALALTSASRSANVSTFYTTTAHGLAAGQWFTVSNASTSSFNGKYAVKTVVDGTTITADNVGSNISLGPITGTLAYGIAGPRYGETVPTDLVRTPRSYVTFDTKDADGNREPDTVTARFAMAPSPEVKVSGSGTASASTLVDSSKSWTTNQWSSADALAFYYLSVEPVGEVPIVRAITGNTATQLTIAGTLPDTHRGTKPYKILDGAVMVQKLLAATMPTTTANFLPTSGQETYAGATTTFYLAFYATKNGCVQESTRMVQVDPDPVASLSSLTGFYDSTTTQLRWVAGYFDDDAKTWRCYVKKGGWPLKATVSKDPATVTIDPSDLDEQYLRFQGSANQSNFSHNAHDGTWYGMAVPVNSFNSDGLVVKASPVVISGGTSTGSRGIYNVTAAPQVGTSNIVVTYQHTPSTTGTVTVTGYSISESPNTQIPVATNRDVTLDAGGTNSIGGQGQAVHVVSGKTFTASGTPFVYEYAVQLSSGNTETCRTTAYVQGATGGTKTCSASASVSDQGLCTQIYNPGFETTVSCDSSFTIDVSWTSSASAPGYAIYVYRSRDFTPTDWQLIAVEPINVNYGSIKDIVYCNYESTTGIQNYFTYRVDVIRTDTFETVGTSTTTQIARRLNQCRNGGGSTGDT